MLPKALVASAGAARSQPAPAPPCEARSIWRRCTHPASYTHSASLMCAHPISGQASEALRFR
ncbi:hypothetical protein FOMPIDRAFT_1024401 [Fomitopsis schrenkii]|uniref:Uncharacterized protein n=1 Tax=Fomitopsis schrenkii TaxID=2126942 RepID=S8FL13_FOMSC|nr:hypothetical protein FOMPIDRAFT_1024401 [Fomitopsis schrenkii]